MDLSHSLCADHPNTLRHGAESADMVLLREAVEHYTPWCVSDSDELFTDSMLENKE